MNRKIKAKLKKQCSGCRHEKDGETCEFHGTKFLECKDNDSGSKEVNQMSKKELLERVKGIEQRRIKDGYLRGPISGFFKISERSSIKKIREFCKVCLRVEI